MSLDFTAYPWLNWAILALTLGCWLMSTLLGALRRGP